MGQIKDIELIPIGNAQGVCISEPLIQKYGFTGRLVLEETNRGILIRKADEDTFKSMARAKEDWRDLDVTLMDGLSDNDS